MIFLLLFLTSSLLDDDSNILYVSETNFTDVMSKKSAVVLFVQQGSDERYRYLSDFINAATPLMTRCFFAIMDGDRNRVFVQKLHMKHTKGYYFYRNGKFIEEYAGDTNPDAITKYAMEKTGLPFTTFPDYPTAQDFIETHKTAVVLFLKSASGNVFEQYHDFAEKHRDSYAFGFCPDQDITYELRIRYVPAIVLYRNTDKAKIISAIDLNETLNETAVYEWIRENEKPNYEVFDINHQQVYANKEIGIFFVPVETEDNEKAMRQIKAVTAKYRGKLSFTIIDAATGNRFMQSIGFGRFADPAFAILNYTSKRTLKYLYTEGGTFRSKELGQFIDSYFNGKVNYTIKNSKLPVNNTGPIFELNAYSLRDTILGSKNFTVVLFYEEWDRLYKEFEETFFEIANETTRKDITFAKMDAVKNDILYGNEIKETPCIKFFPKDPSAKIFTYSKKLNKKAIEKWIKKSITKYEKVLTNSEL